MRRFTNFKGIDLEIVVTGGAGFLGARLITTLLEAKDSGRAGLPVFERVVSLDLAACPVDDPSVISEIGDVTDPTAAELLIGPDTAALFHLAAVVSSQAEAEFETGMAVNLDGTRNLLEACRAHAKAPFVFFSSSLAVFGASCPPVVGDDQVLRPQSSYGSQKAIGELLVADYSRKGFIKGVVGRLPTVVIRPGKPNAAASSFASSILREPIAGEMAVCTVKPDLDLWISSPDAVIRNIVTLAAMDHSKLDRQVTLNLPGITASPVQMIDALRDTFGEETANLVKHRPDPEIEAIVASWPSRFDTVRASRLGLSGDSGLPEIIEHYVKHRTG
jgi:nucleoside-diphosphate-sugar epimerase